MAVAEPQLRTLTPAQVDKFHVDGYLVVEDLLTPDEVADLAERADLIAAGKAEPHSRGKHPARTRISGRRTRGRKPRALRPQALQPRRLRRPPLGPRHQPQDRRRHRRPAGHRRHQALRRPALHEAPRNRRRPGLAPGLSRLARHPPDGPCHRLDLHRPRHHRKRLSQLRARHPPLGHAHPTPPGAAAR